MSGTTIVFETQRFEYREPKPHFINDCCFGEDLAAWLRAEVMRSSGEALQLSEPIQEDYGWGFWVECGSSRVWIAISCAGSSDGGAEWIVSVGQGRGFFQRLFAKRSRCSTEFEGERF